MEAKLFLQTEELKEEKHYLLKKLSKLFTIKKSIIFKKVFKNGITINSNYFTLKFLPYDSNTVFTNHVEFGFILSKKLGNAVKRNYIKRKLKNALKECLSFLPFKGFYVFIAKRDILSSDYNILVTNIKNTLIFLNTLLKQNELNK